MLSAVAVLVGGLALAAISGAGGAWWLHRRTRLSAVNAYLFALVAVAVFVGSLATLRAWLVAAAGPVAVAGVVGAALARRWRLGALGAGGELREFERSRVMVWTALAPRARARRRASREPR